jgi:hypothetical protein
MRKEKEYLPKLLEYIELANKIPKDYCFATFDGVYHVTQERLKGQENIGSSENLIETYKELSKEFPYDLYNYVFSELDSGNTFETLESIRKKYDFLSSLSHGLGTLAYAVTEEYFGEKVPINETIAGVEEFLPEYVPILTVSISVNNEGFIEAKTSEFFDFITTHKIEARRIRNCVICYKIFWANRVDKWTCSKPCGNTLRQRIWQIENKEEYNEKRRRNYAYKTSMKKQKENKSNGTL